MGDEIIELGEEYLVEIPDAKEIGGYDPRNIERFYGAKFHNAERSFAMDYQGTLRMRSARGIIEIGRVERLGGLEEEGIEHLKIFQHILKERERDLLNDEAGQERKMGILEKKIAFDRFIDSHATEPTKGKRLIFTLTQEYAERRRTPAVITRYPLTEIRYD